MLENGVRDERFCFSLAFYKFDWGMSSAKKWLSTFLQTKHLINNLNSRSLEISALYNVHAKKNQKKRQFKNVMRAGE